MVKIKSSILYSDFHYKLFEKTGDLNNTVTLIIEP